jgi:hypothetical protein
MRCEGWTRRGGAFTLGKPVWSQCDAEATVMLSVVKDEIAAFFPACNDCWRTCIEREIEIVKSEPIGEQP